MKLRLIKILALLLIPSFLTAHADDSFGQLIDYSKSKNIELINKLKNSSDANTKFRILQLGDSHTAGDFFTGELRDRLQQQFGNGGIGWIYANKVYGQRLSRVAYENNGWDVITSRKHKDDFPLGGVISRSTHSGDIVKISATDKHDKKLYKITMQIRKLSTNAESLIIRDSSSHIINVDTDFNNLSWNNVTFYTQLPFSYQNTGGVWDVGNINLETGSSGIIVSAMGINGAQLSDWSKWHNGLIKDLTDTNADLVILSYGTNESLSKNLNIVELQKIWENSVDVVKQALPHAGILIIGAPEVLSSQAGTCGTRTKFLNEVQNMQKHVAQKEQTLYWSWQDANGGVCSMKNWISGGYGRKDGVHFTEKGYDYSASKLANDMINLTK